MSFNKIFSSLHVNTLTLMAAFLLSGCSHLPFIGGPYYPEQCKTHAYLENGLGSVLTQRFHSNAPVRLAIIPFSTPAGIAYQNADLPGLGNRIAWNVHALLLKSGEAPIVEVLNRQDWPGKKEEFFTGNFGALAQAREAGYDLVLVGYLEPMHSLDEMTAESKLIEVESGMTIWYGQNTASTWRGDRNRVMAHLGITDRRPDLIYNHELVEALSACVADSVVHDPALDVPKPFYEIWE